MIKNNLKPVYLIDGVVGSGKSSLATKLSKSLDLKMYEELASSDTISLLDKFYQDQKRWSFTLQVHFLNERFKMIKEIHKNNGGLLDRSIFGDRIFAELLHENGEMSDEEFRTYNTLLDSMLEHAQPPKLLIFIDCPVDIAIERIKKRNRVMELGVPRNYWEKLNEKYKKWYNYYDISPKFSLNVNDYDCNNEKDIQKITQKIKDITDDLPRRVGFFS